jgi:hypothetical protein
LSGPILIISGLLGLGLLGCDSRSGNSSNLHPVRYAQGIAQRRVIGEEDLLALIRAGMTSQEVVQVFGQPQAVNTLREGGVSLVYLVPERVEDVGRLTLAGFQIYVRDGKVTEWSPIHGFSEPPVGAPSPAEGRGQPNSMGKQRQQEAFGFIAFFVVHDQETARGEYIDTYQFPQLGWIREHADLEIRTLKSLGPLESIGPTSSSTNQANSVITRFRITAELCDSDIRVFESLTRTNIGARLLVMAGENPVAAPLILEPVSKGEVVLSVPDESAAQELYSVLKQLLAQGCR